MVPNPNSPTNSIENSKKHSKSEYIAAACQGDSGRGSRYSKFCILREEKMTWWTWMILGAVLLGAELLAIDAQFYLVFLGISAALVGLAGLLGLVMPEWVQWVVFAVLALVFMVTFRRSLYMKIRGSAKGFSSSMAGGSVDVTSNIAPGERVRLKYRGTEWTAQNISDKEIASGTRAKIVNVDGLTLQISAD